jgi:hypothetical protein
MPIFPPAHLLLLLCAVICITACGEEAPPRAVKPAVPTPTPLRPRLPTPAPAAQPAPDERTMGDPNAPIVVIEYGDYQ